MRQTGRRGVFFWPLMLGLLSFAGLVAALWGDGVIDHLAAIAVGSGLWVAVLAQFGSRAPATP